MNPPSSPFLPRHVLLGHLLLLLLAGCAAGSGSPLPRHENASEFARIRSAWEAAGYPSEIGFAVLGDNRDGDAVHRKLIAQMNADGGILFVVNTGDLVDDGSEAGFRRFVKDIGASRAPYLVVPGNHDSRNDGERIYLETFGARDWAFDLGGNRFIGLDNHSGGFSAAQLEWLDRELATPRRCFVFMHQPPPLGAWSAHSFRRTSERFLEIVARRRPSRVFCGHIHGYSRREGEGTVWVVTGGAGAPQWGLHEIEGVENVFHYVRVEAGQAGVREEVVELVK